MAAEIIIALIGVLSGAVAGHRTRQSKSQPDTGRPLGEADLAAKRSKAMLASSVKQAGPAMLMDTATGNASPARFISIDDDTVSFETTGDGGDQECWSKDALVAVHFNLEARARIFVAPIADVTLGTSGSAYLQVALPRYIGEGETRAAFRVAIGEDADVEVTVLHGQRDFAARATDASTTGVGLVCDRDDLEGVKVGDEVEVMLRLESEMVQRTGTVRRVQGMQLGLSFPVSSDEDVPGEQQTYFDLIRTLIDREAA
ncbi:MAG: PilZ domain-containing protein [Myxococcales bacterium]|nr:PilZ domain-containing protein [Myxococcales bacterium]MDD9970316.1 PilZ domain-containing protein [Myxococcales bacterium]